MTVDGSRSDGDAAWAAFGVLDPKLNIFALANGMDLEKLQDARRLCWYRDGRERGILLTESERGIVTIVALAWKDGEPDSAQRTEVQPDLTEEQVAEDITAVLERAVEAANAL